MTRPALALALLVPLLAAAGEPPATPKPGPLVAVLYFDVHSNDPELNLLNKGLAEMMITDLANAGQVRVVDRLRLEEIMAEQKLQASKAFDQETAVKVGKLLGAKYLVAGSVLQTRKGTNFDTVVRSVESGQVLKGTRVRDTEDDVFGVEQKLVDGISKAIAQVEALSPPKPPKKAIRLKLDTAARYGQALDALDRKDTAKAKEKLQEVVKEQPDFVLASLDLDKLMK